MTRLFGCLWADSQNSVSDATLTPPHRIENRSRQDLRSGCFEEFPNSLRAGDPRRRDYDCSKPAQSPKVSQVGSLPTRVVLEGMDGILHSEEFGTGGMPPLICLHGLLGSSRNWRSVAKDLASDFRVWALDLPNHGDSFHREDASVKAMAMDLLHWLDQQKLGSVTLCGHSLGGKVAMRFACDHPKRIQKLVIADIAPRDYPPEHHVPTLEALLSLDLSGLNSRKEADEALASQVPNWAFRQFLLTNLTERDGCFHWKANLSALRASIDGLSSNPLQAEETFEG